MSGQVTTKHGTKMVLSVSKTFLKLKDLILEKKTLEEQMTKMKHVNENIVTNNAWIVFSLSKQIILIFTFLNGKLK